MFVTDIKVFFSFLKPYNIYKWFNVEYLFVNYFWLTTIGAVISLFFKNEWIINYIFPLIIYFLFWRSRSKITINNIVDILWITSFIWILFTWCVNDYPHKTVLVFKAVFMELAYMMSYWISRTSTINYVQLIIRNATKPLVISCIIGIYCFFYEPAWYQAMTDNAILYVNGTFDKESMLELYRLRSVYISPYYLAYFCAITLIYEFFLLFIFGKKTPRYNYHMLFMILLLVTDVLCMMRAPLACMIAGFFAAYLYSFVYVKGGRGTLKMVMILFVVVVVLIVGMSLVDLSIVDFMYNKINILTDDDGSFITKRFYLQEQSATLIGEGYGRYSRLAYYMYDMPSIADGEYMKVLSEQGVIGLSILLVMLFIGWVKSFIESKSLYLEFCLLSMLFVCMIGANPLSTYDKHCFLFWMALGQISRYKKNNVII